MLRRINDNPRVRAIGKLVNAKLGGSGTSDETINVPFALLEPSSGEAHGETHPADPAIQDAHSPERE